VIDLTSRQFAIVDDILERHVPEHEVRAFGSRIRGRPRPTSDLDLVIMTKRPLPSGLLADLKEAFSESALPFKVDLVDWAACDETFRAIIEQHSEIVRAAQ